MGIDELAAGRTAYTQRSWAEAREHLTRADPATLGVEDLRALGSAAYLSGDRETAVGTLQRAHTLAVAAGDHLAAALDAHQVAMFLAMRGEQAVAGGWLARAQRLLETEPDDARERGYLLIHEMFRQLGSGDVPGAAVTCERIGEIGRRHDDPDLVAFACSSLGRCLMLTGEVHAGLRRLDEAMAALTTGEVSPIMAGHVYCSMVEGCQEVGDYQRMTEWTDALQRWCDDQPGLMAFTGQCAVHRGQILRAHGSFREALDELARAAERYAADGSDPAIGMAMYERAEVLRTLGDLSGAEQAYEEAARWGYEPQPGLTLLSLARGRTTAAVASIHRLLAETRDPLTRARRLGAAVEVLVAAGELDEAERAADELASLAGSFALEAVTASASYAAGLIALSRGDASGSLTHFRRAWKGWTELGARYDAARARMKLGVALRALGDDVSATSELTVAMGTFTELGAEPAKREVERLLAVGLPDGLTVREAEVLRLVASGRTNPQIAADLFLSEKTVARHLSNIFTKIGVTSRTAAAAYAHDNGLT